jgi:hypothetical protein
MISWLSIMLHKKRIGATMQNNKETILGSGVPSEGSYGELFVLTDNEAEAENVYDAFSCFSYYLEIHNSVKFDPTKRYEVVLREIS